MNEPHSGPLAGVRIVEFAGIGPAPHCAMLLADMGAEVLRIEREGTAVMNPVVERARQRLALDIRTDEGRTKCREIVATADVVLEGFRPGVMERLGLGPDELCGADPRLIYARMTGWGQEGPLAKTAGHDIGYIAITGALDAIGKPGEPPIPPQNLVGDFGGGSLYCALGIVAALFERERSGKGQVVDAAIVDGATSLMSFFFGARHLQQLSAKRGEGMLGGAAHFYRSYECADGRYIAVGAIEPQFYAELLEKIGADKALAQGQLNPANWDDYTELLKALFASKPLSEWMELLDGSDACAAPVVPLEEAREHPHLKARGNYVEHGGIWHTAPAPRFSRTPGAIRENGEGGEELARKWASEETGGR